MYSTGRGVPRNDDEAFRLYALAAEKGHPEGLNNLGYMYESGRGTKADVEEAIKLYKLALAKGNPRAMTNPRKPISRRPRR